MRHSQRRGCVRSSRHHDSSPRGLRRRRLDSAPVARRTDDATVYRAVGKRIVDLAVGIVGLVILSPLMAALSVIIRREDHGPALFRQRRIGKDGEEFVFLKFRSMPVDTPHVESAMAATLQTTRVGSLIRRTSLDELPQLLNVVAGDMSIVGPRPPLASQEELIELRRSNGALALCPGITGLAQVMGYDDMPTDEKARWDGEYAQTLSLLTDAKIVALTFLYVMRPPPRY